MTKSFDQAEVDVSATLSGRHLDVVIVGAGISGIAAAVQLQRSVPDKSFTILEMGDDIGGTWNLFKYPGFRSDSDMFTLAFSFKPWTSEQTIAPGGAILDYLRETVDEFDLRSRIHLQRRVTNADWSSETNRWTLQVSGPDGVEVVTCQFLYTAAGYYDYETGYNPSFPGADQFEGQVIHPQSWPEDFDHSGKRIAVIGSGATAITLVPALAQTAEQVTMVQRSPSYVIIDDAEYAAANQLRREVGAEEAHQRSRALYMSQSQERYLLARNDPDQFKKEIFDAIDGLIGQDLREKHFTPNYAPWDQRLCLVPDGDLFEAIRDRRAEVVTGHIETFTPEGLRMADGTEVIADVIVTATGLNVVTLGKIAFAVDGTPVDFSQAWTYKGIAYSGVPNLVNAFGYFNASWTLRIEPANVYWCEILDHMDAIGAQRFTPELRPQDANMTRRAWLSDSTSGYLVRAQTRFPSQGDHAPWTNPQNHDEVAAMFATGVQDSALSYS